MSLVPVYPWYRIRFDDGTYFNYGGTQTQIESEIARVSPGDVQGYRRLVAQSRDIFDVGFVQLGDKPFSSVASMVAVAPNMIRLKSFLSVYQMVSLYIKSEKLRQVFSFQPLLVGGNPFTTTSIYSLIQHVERQWGVFYAMGGTGAIVSAMEKLIRELGGEILLDTTVDEIMADGGKALGVATADGAKHVADLVVVNGDPPFVYSKLLKGTVRKKWTDKKIEKLQYSMGLFVLYFGTSKQYETTAHHSILLGKRYKELLKDIFDRKVLAEDFSLYLHIPSRTDPSMAPPGKDCMYVLCPVPNLQSGVDWQVEGPRLRDRIVSYLEETELPELSKYIEADFYVTPEYFQSELLTAYGTGFSVQPLLTQSAYFRFHNKSEELENLFFVGAGTHPGAGMPGVLCSAKVLQNLLSPGSLERDAGGNKQYDSHAKVVN